MPVTELPVVTPPPYRWRPIPPRYSPCGRTLAVATTGRVHLLDPFADRTRHTLTTELVAGYTFTPDGDRLLTVGNDGVTAWNVATGQVVERFAFDAHFGPATAVAVAPDGLTAYAGGVAGPVVRWDL
jgi:WD40 repeat protein